MHTYVDYGTRLGFQDQRIILMILFLVVGLPDIRFSATCPLFLSRVRLSAFYVECSLFSRSDRWTIRLYIFSSFQYVFSLIGLVPRTHLKLLKLLTFQMSARNHTNQMGCAETAQLEKNHFSCRQVKLLWFSKARITET